MAKEGMTLADKLALMDKIAEDSRKKYGKVIMGRVGVSEEMTERLKIKWLETPNPDFNRAVGGGLPKGRLTYISGGPDSGKSCFVLETIGYMMRNQPDSIAVWIETEESLTDEMFEMFGIDKQRFFLIEFTKDTAMETVMDQLYGILTSMPVDLVCINSMKHLVPSAELNADMESSGGVAVAARSNARVARRLTSVIAENQTAMVIITHTHTDIGAYGAPQTISGGRALRYWSSLTLMFNKVSIAKGDPITKDQGLKIAVTVRKNHCLPAQNVYVKFEYYILFGVGTEQILPAIPALVERKIIKRAGASYTILDEEGKEAAKYVGKNNFRDAMVADPELWQSLMKRLEGAESTLTAQTEEEIADAQEEDRLSEETVKKLV